MANEENINPAFADAREKHGLGKFKDEESLCKAYKELEKKQSSYRPSDEDSEEELIKKTAEFYSKVSTEKTYNEGSLAKIEKDLVKTLKLPPRIAAAAVGRVTSRLSDVLTQKDDEQVNQSVKEGQDALSKLVNPQEPVSQEPEGQESNKAASAGAKDGITGTREELEKEYFGMIENTKSDYYNPASPGHQTAKARAADLERVLFKN